MANTELKTRILLRNDTAANWVTANPVLSKGEFGVEIDTRKVKVGDGSANWSSLSYINLRPEDITALEANVSALQSNVSVLQGNVATLTTDIANEATRAKAAESTLGNRATVLEGNVSDLSTRVTTLEAKPVVTEKDIAAGADKAAELANISSPSKGDIAILREAIDAEGTKREYTGYVYSGTAWAAMDGNYNAENVYFRSNISLAGDYTAVGNIKLSEGTLEAKGKSVATLFNDIFDKTLQPTITSTPTAKFSAYSGVTSTTVEPGYAASGTVSYTLALDGVGSYTYGPATGITESGTYSLTYNNGTTTGTLTTKTGTFGYDFTVGTSNETVSVTASSVSYTQGAIAKDNKGNDSNPTVRIAAGSVSAGTKSNTFTAKRKSFWAADDTTDTTFHTSSPSEAEKAADSAVVRGLANNEFGTITSKRITLTSAKKRIIVAVPGSHSLTSVTAVDGMGLEAKGNFTTYTNNVYVGGCDATASDIGDYETTYTVFVWEDASTIPAGRYDFVIA